MKPYREVFERYEQKYLLTNEQVWLLRDRLSVYMTEDNYGLHTLCNLYLDTDDYQIIRMSLEKPVYKEKLRLRSYGIPKSDDLVFMELKKKYKGIVHKRRVAYRLELIQQYLECGELLDHPSQIFQEIDWFMHRYQPQPKVFIAYDRVALYGLVDPNLRITFDRNLRWRSSELDLSKGDHGSPLLDPSLCLMEIKVLGAIPLWLSHLLAELQIFPTSFSKYGACYQQYLCH